ncbi:MAG: NHL repeat-containing protein [Eubacteriales bacterium]
MIKVAKIGWKLQKNYVTITLLILISVAIVFMVSLYYSRSRAGVIKPLNNVWFNPPSFLFSIYGEKEGMLQDPLSVAAAPDGKIFVADVGAKDIKVFDDKGKYLFKFFKLGNSGKLLSPLGLAISGGTVYVTDSTHNQIYQFDLEGNFKGAFISQNTKKKLIAFTPVGIEVTPSNIYFTDILFHRVVETDFSGNLIKTIGSPGNKEGQLAYPDDIAVSPNGKIYVSDANNFRVQVSEDGQQFKIFGSNNSETSVVGSLVRGIAVDNNNYVWISDALDHKIIIVNKNGELVYLIGQTESVQENLSYPEGINVSNNRVYIADRGNHRIQVYRR